MHIFQVKCAHFMHFNEMRDRKTLTRYGNSLVLAIQGFFKIPSVTFQANLPNLPGRNYLEML